MIARLLSSFLIVLVLSSCATTPRAALSSGPPRAIELQAERTVSTMHFPAGIYSLDSADATGWFYRAPRGVMQHGFGGFYQHEGGIFLARADGSIRAYVIWAGGRTKLGNLAGAPLRFR